MIDDTLSQDSLSMYQDSSDDEEWDSLDEEKTVPGQFVSQC